MKAPQSQMDPAEISDDVRRWLSRLHNLRLWIVGSWLALIPFMALALAVQPPAWLMTPIAIAYVGTWAVLLLAQAFYRCPACRHFFNLGRFLGGAFSSKCLHCGVPISMRAMGRLTRR